MYLVAGMGLLFIPGPSRNNHSNPLCSPKQGDIRAATDPTVTGGHSAKFCVLQSFHHTFLSWYVFDEPSKLISSGQGERSGGRGTGGGSVLGRKMQPIRPLLVKDLNYRRLSKMGKKKKLV